MSRLKTVVERTERVYTIASLVIFLAAIGVLAWAVVRDGITPLLALAGGFVVFGAVAWVVRWIDTGKWFR